MTNDIIKNIKLTENSILKLFKEYKIIGLDVLRTDLLKEYLAHVQYFYPSLIIDNNINEVISKEIDLQINRLCNKKYLFKFICKFDNEDSTEFLTIRNPFDLNVRIDRIVLRAGLLSTVLYYNSTDDIKIVEITIKTEANLTKESFVDSEILDFHHTNHKYYNIYNIIFISQPYSYLTVLTDKNHKCFNNIKDDNIYKELYKYYGIKLFINEDKLIKIYDKDKNKPTAQHIILINNPTRANTKITIFLDEIKKENISHKDIPIFMFTNTELEIITNTNIYAYLSDHDKCIIFNNGVVVYEC